jgi:hypothetical protein
LASLSLTALVAALSEISTLESANPSPTGKAPKNSALTKAIGRAAIVLLTSHFERYLYAINEEAIQAVVNSRADADRLPLEIRLLHSRPPIDSLAQQQWKARGPGLEQMIRDESSLWSKGVVPTVLVSDRLLDWMKSPKSKDILRYYRQWGIEDIFSSITRTAASRSSLWLRITSLVDKRNSIAHGDAATDATQSDVRIYKAAVAVFAGRADRVLSRRLSVLFTFPPPW